MTFDPEKMRRKLATHIEIVDDRITDKYRQELHDLEGFDEALLAEFGGTSEQLDEIIAELEKARLMNLSQAQLLDNLRALGSSTYNLARKVSDLVP